MSDVQVALLSVYCVITTVVFVVCSTSGALFLRGVLTVAFWPVLAPFAAFMWTVNRIDRKINEWRRSRAMAKDPDVQLRYAAALYGCRACSTGFGGHTPGCPWAARKAWERMAKEGKAQP